MFRGGTMRTSMLIRELAKSTNNRESRDRTIDDRPRRERDKDIPSATDPTTSDTCIEVNIAHEGVRFGTWIQVDHGARAPDGSGTSLWAS